MEMPERKNDSLSAVKCMESKLLDLKLLFLFSAYQLCCHLYTFEPLSFTTQTALSKNSTWNMNGLGSIICIWQRWITTSFLNTFPFIASWHKTVS